MSHVTGCLRNVSCRQGQNGFTFIELLVVLVIMSVLAGTLTVSLRGRSQTYALRAAARDLVASVNTASTQARNTRTDHRIVILNSGSAYRVEVLASGSTTSFEPVRGMGGGTRSLGDNVRMTGVSDDGVSFSSMPDELAFGADGQGFNGFVRLVNDRGETMTMYVMPKTMQADLLE